MSQHTNNWPRPHRAGYSPGGQEPYYPQTYGHGDSRRQENSSYASNYEGVIGDNGSVDRGDAGASYHRDMTAFAAYPIHSQIASSATWNQTGHPDFLHPSPALSPNHFDAWQSCMETDTRHSSHENQGSNYQLSSRLTLRWYFPPVNGNSAASHFSYQSDGYNPHGLQPQDGPWNDHRNDIARFNREYTLRSTQFFSIGRVLSVFWAQPAGDTSVPHDRNNPYFYATRLGQEVHANIRRMVVVKNEQGCSWCLAINTYGERGLLKRGIDLNTHAAVYMRGSEPAPNDPTRVPGLPPIMINPYSPREQLHSKSYLNFGKVFTVDHNIKVKPVGHVSEESMRTFRRAWRRSVDLNENDEYNDFEPRDSDTTNSYR